MASITAKTIPELIELGAYSSDINWDFEHGFIRFPGRESEAQDIFLRTFPFVNQGGRLMIGQLLSMWH